MPDPLGFLSGGRKNRVRRPVEVRLTDWREVYEPDRAGVVRGQARRCMDCGIPFCHDGCPLGNRIPEWNDLVRTDRWRTAIEELHATNNFPEFTGRLCPAPCEAACVLGIIDDPVAIEQIELAIVERAWALNWILPQHPERRRPERVTVVGSGPAGLAAAQQLTRAGYRVTVLERSDRLGGLLRYGIPEFKMEKAPLDRRLTQLAAEGTAFATGVEAGVDVPAAELRAVSDAVVLALGAHRPRDVDLPGRHLDGIHQALDYLVPANRVAAGLQPGSPIDAAGRHVVIVGGGDTAADCLGTVHRQGAASVTQLDLYPRPPLVRDEARSPWPTWPWILHTYAAHEEGGERRFAVAVERFLGDDAGRVRALRIRRVEVERGPGGERRVRPTSEEVVELRCTLALLAIGFTGVEPSPLLAELGLGPDERGVVPCGDHWETAVPGVFVCGDAARGASLVVWAIAEGRACAAAVDARLSGGTSLPVPVRPGRRPLSVPRP
ncbi:MAG: glutamate synthase small chain [Actinomycetota bacterium]|jgi:glutamate synthase (NADPH/NADH) small chain|nr:gltB1 [Cryptosporangiaceae bacterium]MDQ1676325.1 glutamate synthase small chain [Actinomycetota bacterium]